MGKIVIGRHDPRNSNLNLNDAKDLAKAAKNPNLKNLAKVAKNPRIRNAAKAANKASGGKFDPKNYAKHPLENDQQGKLSNDSNDLNDFGKHSPNDMSDDYQMDSDKNSRNPFDRPDQDDKDIQDHDENSQDHDNDSQDHDKDGQDHDNDSQDKDNDSQNHDKNGQDHDRDKDSRDYDKGSRDHGKDKGKNKSDSENLAAQNVAIVRRKPNNRRKKASSAALRHGAKVLGKDGSKLLALHKAATLYDRYIAPLANALRNRFVNIGNTFKNLFNGATKIVSNGINAVAGLVGLSIAASTSSIISSFTVMLMLIFLPLMLLYFYLATMDNNPVSRLINYTTCIVKKATSDDSDDDTGIGTSGAPGQTTLAYLKKHDISAKEYSSWNKTAVSISKAVHKITGLKTSLVYAQLYNECGGKWSYAAKTDNNFSGVTYTGDNKGYGGTKGSPRPANEGGNYVHFKTINGYVCAYADTLMEISSPPGDKKSHIALLKKMNTTSQFNDYLHTHGYYAADPKIYLANLNAGAKAYNDYMKNGDTDSAKISAIDYEPDSDSDSNSSLNDCTMENSDNLGVSRASIVKEAKSWVGKFHYSASNRFFQDVKNLSDRSSIPTSHTTDCSGFVWFVLTRVGIKVPQWYTGDMENYAEAGKNHLKKINKEDALPGDIVIMNVGGGEGGNGHTAILTSKWGGSYLKTNIVEMGGYNKDHSDDVNTTNIEYAFKSLIDEGARVTFARVTGLKGSSTNGDDDGSSNSKVITRLSKKENDARKWIVSHESGGNYKAVNGRYYGAYQLDKEYLTNKDKYGGNGTLSKANQDYVGYEYMKQRYGSWVKAKEHWVANGWW